MSKSQLASLFAELFSAHPCYPPCYRRSGTSVSPCSLPRNSREHPTSIYTSPPPFSAWVPPWSERTLAASLAVRRSYPLPTRPLLETDPESVASLSFPSYPTLSLSVPLALVGLSALVLSSFSTLPTFLTPTHELDPTRYMVFLGILSPGINLFSAFFMRVIPPRPLKPVSTSEAPTEPINSMLHLDEHTPLLVGGPEAAREDVEAAERGKEVRWTNESRWK